MLLKSVALVTVKVHKASSILAGIVTKTPIERMRHYVREFSVTIRKRDRRA